MEGGEWVPFLPLLKKKRRKSVTLVPKASDPISTRRMYSSGWQRAFSRLAASTLAARKDEVPLSFGVRYRCRRAIAEHRGIPLPGLLLATVAAVRRTRGTGTPALVLKGILLSFPQGACPGFRASPSPRASSFRFGGRFALLAKTSSRAFPVSFHPLGGKVASAGLLPAISPIPLLVLGEKAQLVVQTCLEPKWPRPSLSHLGHPHSTIAQDVKVPTATISALHSSNIRLLLGP